MIAEEILAKATADFLEAKAEAQRALQDCGSYTSEDEITTLYLALGLAKALHRELEDWKAVLL